MFYYHVCSAMIIDYDVVATAHSHDRSSAYVIIATRWSSLRVRIC